ncbi:YIP1 family protein [Candidatus Pacearchaeota archaeon]|nr:YIP1 family protein [Candidatus Pacearchaeota archaeon]
MVRGNIREFLAEGRKQGMSFDFLRGELVEAGYRERDIEEAIYDVRSRYMDGFFSKIIKALLAPKQLFETVKADSVGASYGYLIGLLVIGFIFFAWKIASFVATTTLPTSQFLGGNIASKINYAPLGLQIAFILVFYFIALIVLAGIASSIFSGVFHIFVKLFGGKGSYRESYGIFVYSATPLFLVLGPASIFILDYFFGSGTPNSLAYTIALVVLAGAFVWRMLLMILGSMENQNMSLFRALLAVLTLIIIMAILMLSFKSDSIKEKVNTFFTPSENYDSNTNEIPLDNTPYNYGNPNEDYSQYAEPG